MFIIIQSAKLAANCPYIRNFIKFDPFYEYSNMFTLIDTPKKCEQKVWKCEQLFTKIQKCEQLFTLQFC